MRLDSAFPAAAWTSALLLSLLLSRVAVAYVGGRPAGLASIVR
jgi:hypothetical protein